MREWGTVAAGIMMLACNEASAPAADAGRDASASLDAFRSDAQLVPDAGRVDAGADAGRDVGTDVGSDSGECARDLDCPSQRPVCRIASATCVECTPMSRAACAAGQYCTAAFTCAPGCGADGDCTPLRCDLARHVCLGCLDDTDCPLGAVCDPMGACVPGCSAGHGCAGTETCCGVSCFDLATDTSHCGDCARTCDSGPFSTARCDTGSCVLDCSAPWIDCDGVASNGCEAQLGWLEHCTRCDDVCSNAHGFPMCGASGCSITCDSGYAECNGDYSDGCETTLGVEGSCGGCSHTCAPAACTVDGCAAVCTPTQPYTYRSMDIDATGIYVIASAIDDLHHWPLDLTGSPTTSSTGLSPQVIRIAGGQFFVATFNSVYVSTDRTGTTWSRVGGPLTYVNGAQELLVETDTIWITEADMSGGGLIDRLDRSTGTVTTFAFGGNGVYGIARIGGVLYAGLGGARISGFAADGSPLPGGYYPGASRFEPYGAFVYGFGTGGSFSRANVVRVDMVSARVAEVHVLPAGSGAVDVAVYGGHVYWIEDIGGSSRICYTTASP